MRGTAPSSEHLNIREILESTARLQEQLINVPKLQIFFPDLIEKVRPSLSGNSDGPDGGAGAVTQVEHPGPVDVEDGVEAGAVPARK